MAKKKESTTTETTDLTQAIDRQNTGQESVSKPGRGRMSAASAAGGAAQGEAASQPAATRGRKKKTDVPAAEMGSPVTRPASDGHETIATPAKRGRASKTETAVAPTGSARGRKPKAAAPTESEGVVVPVASSGNVTEQIVLKPKRSAKAAVQQTDKPAAFPAGGVTLVQQEPTASVQSAGQAVSPATRFSDFDIYLFKEGRHYTLYDKLGSHRMEHEGRQGTYFAVWAPNAEKVSVMGDFNGWSRDSHQLHLRGDSSGIWEGFVADVPTGVLYKYHIKSRYHLYHVEKSDPFAFCREEPPHTASVVSDLEYAWQDQQWLERRNSMKDKAQPYSVYELHLGSWRRKMEENNRSLTYRELADELPAYVQQMGFTHVELMPIMFHPFAGSWGYQVTGYFAPASTFGSPQDLMHLIDTLHQHDIGVILDWVPSHFPSDEHGIAYFDGTHLYEHADPRKGFHPDWNSYIFNYGRSEVRSFLISNALFWLDKYHADGLRVDAVASMLYLDYSRKEGEWIPNEHGGRENLEAISLLKDFNQAVRERFPDVKTIAEESTAWPGVTAPVEHGGLGFDMKWMMGWMHDTLDYFSKDPIYRRYHQGEITFSMMYAFSEKFMLPLSHDEVVHGKGALLQKMPGDEWQRFANLRTLYAYMYAHPGGKLLFMGADIAQSSEWNHDSSLDWHLLQYGYHHGVQEELRELNAIYKQEPALYAYSFDARGFEWVDYNDAHNSVISFLRKGENPSDTLLVVCNFTPAMHEHYRLGVPQAGQWVQVFNSDDSRYGGSNQHNNGPIQTVPEPYHGREQFITMLLPPLSVVYFKLQS
ncbi:1,4-alpha-glucan branching protein GlgB [Pontibacter russatus]|uniref:1,4-alpha-glucan branching protein GlgB n=1 Tax=Pontibacter russatus TaxID=2694929 RepID=UPI00293BF3CF|nr:1,4-alpha-glucan branching protein GlgB [Pontibacter russatus]